MGKAKAVKKVNQAGGTDSHKVVEVAQPNPNGNRAEKRAAAREERKKGRQ